MIRKRILKESSYSFPLLLGSVLGARAKERDRLIVWIDGQAAPPAHFKGGLRFIQTGVFQALPGPVDDALVQFFPIGLEIQGTDQDSLLVLHLESENKVAKVNPALFNFKAGDLTQVDCHSSSHCDTQGETCKHQEQANPVSPDAHGGVSGAGESEDGEKGQSQKGNAQTQPDKRHLFFPTCDFGDRR